MSLKQDRQSAATRLACFALAAVYGEREDRWPSALQAVIAAEIEAEMRKRESDAMKRLLRDELWATLDETGWYRHSGVPVHRSYVECDE